MFPDWPYQQLRSAVQGYGAALHPCFSRHTLPVLNKYHVDAVFMSMLPVLNKYNVTDVEFMLVLRVLQKYHATYL